MDTRLLTDDESEIGLLIKVSSEKQNVTEPVLTVLKGYFLHFGYSGRRATAGNIAFPISPSQISYQDEWGKYVSLMLGGTRDPLFQEQFEEIKNAAISLLETNFSELYRKCQVEIVVADKTKPLMFLETVAKTKQEAQELHAGELRKLEKIIDREYFSIQSIYAGEAFRWSIYHILESDKLIKENLFPTSLHVCNGKNWEFLKHTRATYDPIGITDYEDIVNEVLVDAIAEVKHQTKPKYFKPLTEMATVIRSKNAGVNRITFEIFFNTHEEYAKAINSNAFLREKIAKVLEVPLDLMIGSFRADSCNAIKISVHRAILSGTPGNRDVFGAQQHMKLVPMRIPIF